MLYVSLFYLFYHNLFDRLKLTKFWESMTKAFMIPIDNKDKRSFFLGHHLPRLNNKYVKPNTLYVLATWHFG